MEAINDVHYVSDKHVVAHCRTQGSFESFKVAINVNVELALCGVEDKERTMKTLGMISRTCVSVSDFVLAIGDGTKFNFKTVQEGAETYERAHKIHKYIEEKVENLRPKKV